MKFYDVNIDINTTLSTQKLPDNSSVPSFTVTDAKFTIDVKKSTIELTGGVAEYLVSLIISIFRNEIFNYLLTEMNILLKTSAQDYVNS